MKRSGILIVAVGIVAWIRPCLAETAGSTGEAPVPLLLANVAAEPFDHSAFDKILKEIVCEDRIDYQTVKKSHAQALGEYLDKLSAADVEAMARDEQLAFYINLYNATVLQAVAERYREGYSPADGDYALFKEPLARLGKEKITLNDLQNKIIRPKFKEPRIHTAINCAARSCPPLLARAYTAMDLDKTLEENMTRFVRDTFRNPINDQKRQLKISHIFEWYAEDFGGAKGVPDYISKYYGASVRKYKVSYADYSWELNIVPAK